MSITVHPVCTRSDGYRRILVINGDGFGEEWGLLLYDIIILASEAPYRGILVINEDECGHPRYK